MNFLLASSQLVGQITARGSYFTVFEIQAEQWGMQSILINVQATLVRPLGFSSSSTHFLWRSLLSAAIIWVPQRPLSTHKLKYHSWFRVVWLFVISLILADLSFPSVFLKVQLIHIRLPSSDTWLFLPTSFQFDQWVRLSGFVKPQSWQLFFQVALELLRLIALKFWYSWLCCWIAKLIRIRASWRRVVKYSRLLPSVTYH